MSIKKVQHRVLIVSSSDKVFEFLTDLLPPKEFYPVMRAQSAGEAKRTLLSADFDLLIINTPLPDDFGMELALDMSHSTMGILLLVKNDLLNQVALKTEECGIFTVAKPNTKQAVYGAIRLLIAMNHRLRDMEKKTLSMQEKMADIRTINRAKWLLIENLSMSEKEAHYYIEKQAMDLRISKREVAETIIRTYDN